MQNKSQIRVIDGGHQS